MMNTNVWKKSLTVGIILLFIGVAAAPSITFYVVKASTDNDLVEVTSQACGIQGFGNTNVKLTKQQYKDLQQYMIDFRTQLNQTTTREEAVPIFKDAVVELNKYGLLPKGMSVEQAQRLMTIGYRIHYAPNIVKRLSQDSINYCCLFTGFLYCVYDHNIFIRISDYFLNLTYKYGSLRVLVILTCLFYFAGYFKPLRFMNELDVFGGMDREFFSIGLGGIKKGPYNITCVTGFTGLKILLNWELQSSFFLGFALDIR